MKILKIVLVLALILIFAFGGRLFWLGKKSLSSVANIGMENGHLKACGKKPNCISTQANPESDLHMDPIKDPNIEGVWDNINVMVPDMGLKLENSAENYLHFHQDDINYI